VRLLSIAAIMILVLVFAGCEKPPVAEVNGVPITGMMLSAKVKESMTQHQGTDVDKSALRKSAIGQLIQEELFIQGALEQGVDVPMELVNNEIATQKHSMKEAFPQMLKSAKMTEKQYAHNLRRRMIRDMFIIKIVPDDAISDQEVMAFYKKSPMPFLKEESLNIRFIQIDTPEDSDALALEFRDSGKSFDEFADMIKDADRHVVSAYGWTSPSVFSADIARGIKSLEVGDTGGPYKGTGSYFLIHLKDHKAERPKTFEEARSEIRSMLLSRKRNASVIHWIAEKKNSSKIVIND
jgi:parvulin-like peptidyl-prolyl isomerase